MPGGSMPLLALLTLIPAALSGAMLTADINSGLFGDLDQDDVPNCGGVACGPTAAVNSFAFLQNAYPAIYGNTLIPQQMNFTQYQNQVATATTLTEAMFMDTCACQGTFIEMFITGKYNWIEQQKKGNTIYKAQMNFEWRDESTDFTKNPPNRDPGPKPAWVQENTVPSVDFIFDEINHREDVEIFVAGGPSTTSPSLGLRSTPLRRQASCASSIRPTASPASPQ